jgi:hypothetical protein
VMPYLLKTIPSGPAVRSHQKVSFHNDAERNRRAS